MSEWRTIDSAPKEDCGKTIDLFFPEHGRYVDCVWHSHSQCWVSMYEGPLREIDDGGRNFVPMKPTHFMIVEPPLEAA